MDDPAATPTSAPPPLGRRPLLGAAAAAGATAWVAPVVLGVDAAAAASHAGVEVVATGASGTIITSPDAITWTEQTSGTTNNLKGVAWSPTLLLWAAVGAGGTIATSPDGTTWTLQSSPTPRELNAITWDADGAEFVAVGNAKTVVTSSDGVTWVLATTGLVGDPDYLGVAADGAGVLVAVGPGGLAERSLDGGSTWSAGTTPVATDLAAVEWFGDGSTFVAVGAVGVSLSSSDGTVWGAGVTGTTDDLVGAEWSDADDQVVAVEGDAASQVLQSFDGVFWNSSALGADVKAITYSPALSLYVAVGSAGSVWTSPTSAGPWTPRATPTTQNLLAVTART